MYRVGFGYDNHELKENEELVLGGVKIPSPKGTLAHSDGDALMHAIIDALLGASEQGDIGAHFPDSDPQYKNIASGELLKKTLSLIKGFEIVNLDATIILETPKLNPHFQAIKSNLITILGSGIPINLKAKTNEGQDSLGKGESIQVQVVCLLLKK